jgi:hypothetical protein
MSRHCCSELRIQVAREPVIKSPNERNRPITLMPHIPRWPEAPERSIIGLQPREKDNVRAALKMPDVPLPDLAIGCRR